MDLFGGVKKIFWGEIPDPIAPISIPSPDSLAALEKEFADPAEVPPETTLVTPGAPAPQPQPAPDPNPQPAPDPNPQPAPNPAPAPQVTPDPQPAPATSTPQPTPEPQPQSAPVDEEFLSDPFAYERRLANFIRLSWYKAPATKPTDPSYSSLSALWRDLVKNGKTDDEATELVIKWVEEGKFVLQAAYINDDSTPSTEDMPVSLSVIAVDDYRDRMKVAKAKATEAAKKAAEEAKLDDAAQQDSVEDYCEVNIILDSLVDDPASQQICLSTLSTEALKASLTTVKPEYKPLLVKEMTNRVNKATNSSPQT